MKQLIERGFIDRKILYREDTPECLANINNPRETTRPYNTIFKVQTFIGLVHETPLF